MGNQVIANQEDFVAVANAIRSKAGTTKDMSFPSEFVSTVNNIEAAAVESVKVTITPDSSKGSSITIYATDINGETISSGVGTSISNSYTIKKNDVIAIIRSGSNSIKNPNIMVSGDYTSILYRSYYAYSGQNYSTRLGVYRIHGDIKIT